MRVIRLVNVADCGTPINPKIAHAQLSGAAIMALGATLFERVELDGGQVINASLADYKLPGMHDTPLMLNELVRSHQRNAPFGAKGLGETGSFCVAPAVANALDDAVGVRLFDLPLMPEAVLRALRVKAGNPL